MKILFQGSLGTAFYQKNTKIRPSEPWKTFKNLGFSRFFKVSQFSHSDLFCKFFSFKIVPRVSFWIPKSHTRAPKGLPRGVLGGHQGLRGASFCCRWATSRVLRLPLWHYMAAPKLNFTVLAAQTWIFNDFRWIFESETHEKRLCFLRSPKIIF